MVHAPSNRELLNEPACPHNHAVHGHGADAGSQAAGQGRKKAANGCKQKALPGEAQGGCAFDGSLITLVPITDVAHLVHGPIACGGHSWGTRGSLSSGPTLHRHGFTTDLSEHDIIFGAETKLRQAISAIALEHAPAAIFVYATCVTALIGEDIEAVCRAMAQELSLPVIPVHSAGYRGSKNFGNRLGGQALLDHVIGTRDAEDELTPSINIIGEYNIAGELWSIELLLRVLGIKIQAKITGDGRYADIAAAHYADLNVVICSKALLNVARTMEQRYGIPFIEASFYGSANVSQCLRQIVDYLVDAQVVPLSLIDDCEALIESQTARMKRRLAPYRARLEGKKIVLYTGGVKSWSIIAAAQDLGMQVVATSVRKSTADDQARMRDLLGPEGILMEKGGAAEILRVIDATGADMLIAGGRNQYTALKAGIPFLHINQERHHPYAGYQGIVEMAKEIDESMHSPVWEQVRRPAPWEVTA